MLNKVLTLSKGSEALIKTRRCEHDEKTEHIDESYLKWKYAWEGRWVLLGERSSMEGESGHRAYLGMRMLRMRLQRLTRFQYFITQ